MLTFPFYWMTKLRPFFQNWHLLAEGENAARLLLNKQDYLRYNQDWSGVPLQVRRRLQIWKKSENRKKRNWRKNRIKNVQIRFTGPNAIAARTKIINFIFQIKIKFQRYHIHRIHKQTEAFVPFALWFCVTMRHRYLFQCLSHVIMW